jgi:hypothetical protein
MLLNPGMVCFILFFIGEIIYSLIRWKLKIFSARQSPKKFTTTLKFLIWITIIN